MEASPILEPPRQRLIRTLRIADARVYEPPCEGLMRILSSLCFFLAGAASLGPVHAQQVVSDAAGLATAIAAANSGAGDPTILLVDGTYAIPSSFGLVLDRDGIVIRGASGNRDAVVLQGEGMLGSDVSHVFQVLSDDVTIEDMTLRSVANHAIQIHGEPPYDADGLVLRNLVIRDTGEQMVKASYLAGDPSGSDGGLVEDCLFEFTAGVGPQYYIGGIDAHQASNWIVRRNKFRGIRSPNSNVAEHAVHFWSGSSNTLVERNLIIDCDRGIGFGLGSRGHTGGIIRNNMIAHRDLGNDAGDVGIELESASGAMVFHNTVYLAHSAPGGIAVRFTASTGVQIANNLVHVAGGAPAIWLRDGATATSAGNVGTAQPCWFAAVCDVGSGVIDAAAAIAGAPAEDFDGDPRPHGAASDVGADEAGGPAALLGLSWGLVKARFRR